MLVILIILIVVFVIIGIVGSGMIKKQKRASAQLLNNGLIEEQKGNFHGAIVFYKLALSTVLGVITGSHELTPKGIVLLMDQGGKDIVAKISSLYNRFGVQYNWSDFSGIIQGYARLSQDKQLIDSYGLPKGPGKEYALQLRSSLQRIIALMPENAPAQTVSPLGGADAVQPVIPPLSNSSAVPPAIPAQSEPGTVPPPVPQ
jgi:hypothetical protein